jgi:serine/threonine-protein kinase
VSPVLRDGRYELAERIASGGMGEVWRGRDTTLGRQVAVKVLRPEMAEDDGFRARFENEARHAAALHDPRIATVFDFGDEVDSAAGRRTAYLVMEYVPGRPLSALLPGPLPVDRAVDLVAQVAEGLAVAHAAGIVHRDVKPGNVLVLPDGRAKISDFGISRARGAASLTDTGTIMGTPHYVAPEVAQGQEATPASDVYSLGVVLYECLAGGRPFAGDTPVAIALAHLRDEPRPLPADVPAPLRSLVTRSLAKDPADRPSDAGAFAAALRAAASAAAGTVESGGQRPEEEAATAVLPLAGATRPLPVPPAAGKPQPPSSAPPPPVDPSGSGGRSRRSAWLAVLGAAAAILLVVGVAAALATGGDAPSASDGTDRQTRAAGQATDAQAETRSDSSPSQTPPSSTASPQPAGVMVDPDDYIGENVRDVEKDLKDQGFDVTQEKVHEPGEKDEVVAVAPTGVVPVGSEITLTVLDPPPEDDKGKPGKAKGHDKGEHGKGHD